MSEPFIGTEAMASGAVRNKHELRTRFRAVQPNVYVPADAVLLDHRQRAAAAWLWSQRRGVVAGVVASALHGAKWVDPALPTELIHYSARPPAGIVTHADSLVDGESRPLMGLPVTTPARTAFDIGRRGPLDHAVARLDALGRATEFKVAEVEAMSTRHRGARGLKQLETALNLMDAGAESPKETWLRLLLIRNGYPPPQTQIPVIARGGSRRYYLDMGWPELMLAVEYDGDHHRADRDTFAYDIERGHDLAALGWLLVRVAARSRRLDVLRRVEQAWRSRAH